MGLHVSFAADVALRSSQIYICENLVPVFVANGGSAVLCLGGDSSRTALFQNGSNLPPEPAACCLSRLVDKNHLACGSCDPSN